MLQRAPIKHDNLTVKCNFGTIQTMQGWTGKASYLAQSILRQRYEGLTPLPLLLFYGIEPATTT